MQSVNTSDDFALLLSPDINVANNFQKNVKYPEKLTHRKISPRRNNRHTIDYHQHKLSGVWAIDIS
jgi:hypothetical protein